MTPSPCPLTLALGLTAALALVGCSPPAEKTAPAEKGAARSDTPLVLSPAARQSAGIRTERVGPRWMQVSEQVPGVIEVAANRSTRVTPPAPGKVIRLLVQPGDSVRVGQTLAVLDSFEVAQSHAAEQQALADVQQAQATVQSAQAEARHAAAGVPIADATLAQAQGRLQSARQTLQRQRALAATGAFAQAPLQAAQSELSQAQSELLHRQTELQAHLIAFQRVERLFQAEVVSRAELEQAQLEKRQDEASVDRARRQVEAAQQTLAREQKIARADLLNAREIQGAEAAVQDAGADVQKARSERALALEAVRRAERGAQAAQTALAGARSGLQAARTSLYALEGAHHVPGQGGRITVVAPIAGVVASQSVTLGEALERTAVLFTIQNAGVVQVTAQVPEAQSGRVRPGQRALVYVAAYPGESFTGIVQSVAAQIDEKTRALPVRLLVGNPEGKLKPQMFARVALGEGARRRALAVPESALTEDEGKLFVFVAQGDAFEKRPVTPGIRVSGRAEVLQGLKAGETVVVEGAFVLKSESKKDELKGEE